MTVQKKYYDAQHEPIEFGTGDFVLLSSKNRTYIRKAHPPPPEQKQPPNSIANAYPTQKETQLNARRYRQRITSRTVERRETSLAIRSQTRNWRDKKEEQHTRKRKTSSIPSRALIWHSCCSCWSSITSTMVLGLCFNPILLEQRKKASTSLV